MENCYFDKVIGEFKELFAEQNFKYVSDGVYENEKKLVKIEYDEQRKLYRLLMADVVDGVAEEPSEITSWLFDETQNEKDAESVGMDFCETVREKMGVKIVRKTDAQVDLPTFNKDGNYNVTALAKKVLDVFPQFKDNYRDHVAKYGNFLYLDFFGTYLVPELTKVYSENVKKTVKKVTEMFENAYVNGDREAVNVAVAVLAAAVSKDNKAKENLFAAFGDNTHFKQAVESFIPKVTNNAKLSKALIK